MRQAWATYGADGVYRYTLGRTWDAALPRVAFVMLNPSTATEHALDPTVRRCISYARAWGCGSVEVGNLFALRSTSPTALYAHPDPIGPDNDDALLGIQARAALVVAAWGNHGAHLGRGDAVKAMLGRDLRCLAVTRSGQPGHPLYLRGDAAPALLRG